MGQRAWGMGQSAWGMGQRAESRGQKVRRAEGERVRSGEVEKLGRNGRYWLIKLIG